MVSSPIPYHHPNPISETKDQLKDLFVSLGMQEVISYPLSNIDDLTTIGIPTTEQPPLRLANPMSSDLEYLRPTLRVGLLSTLAYNQAHFDGAIKLFESSRVFLQADNGQPYEREEAAGVLAGPRFDSSWLSAQESLDFFDAKGIVTSALQALNITPDFGPWNDVSFQSGRCAKLTYDGLTIGLMGEVNRLVVDKLNLKPIPTILFELYVETIANIEERLTTNFQPFSRYPQATRDLAIIVPSSIPAETVKSIINKPRLVQHTELFDTYSGDNLPAGTRSLAFHIYLQSMDHTLTTQEVDRAVQGILRNLDNEVGGSLRV
jgi:phenylalanyl-tRNA synthetase beta chain